MNFLHNIFLDMPYSISLPNSMYFLGHPEGPFSKIAAQIACGRDILQIVRWMALIFSRYYDDLISFWE